MRAIVTHFDGDPFFLNFWLTLYTKYWRGECDVIYLSLARSELTKSVDEFNLNLLAQFPEIKVTQCTDGLPPEATNRLLLDQGKEEYVGLIESDGFIYGSGIVDQCFRLLETGQDIVAPPWTLIDEPYIAGDLQCKGFMRCFFFAKRKLLNQIELDFHPHFIPANTEMADNIKTTKDNHLDCFGWISWQLALLRPKTTYTPNNVLTPDLIFKPYSNFKWVHVRQMSSSALGFGAEESGLWRTNKIMPKVKRLIKDFPDGPAEYTYIKAVAFRLLFLDLKPEVPNKFREEYEQVLELVMDIYALPRTKIYELKGFYKGVFGL